MSVTVEQLLGELADRWARGEPLEVEELLVRAGPQSEELAALIDAFFERTPRREPTDDALAFVRSLDDPPLLLARQARRLKLDDLTAALVETLGLPAAASKKVRRYYQELELGQLDPAGVASSVWDALSGLFGRDALALASVRPAAPQAAAMYRAATIDHDLPFDVPSLSENDSEPDEVDRLFGVTQSN